jgi:hypothetical protein
MGRKSILILALIAFVGALAGGAMADIPRESPQSKKVLLSSAAQEFVPEGNWAGTNWQASGPVEAIATPVMVSEESWMKEYGHD